MTVYASPVLLEGTISAGMAGRPSRVTEGILEGLRRSPSRIGSTARMHVCVYSGKTRGWSEKGSSKDGAPWKAS